MPPFLFGMMVSRQGLEPRLAPYESAVTNQLHHRDIWGCAFDVPKEKECACRFISLWLRVLVPPQLLRLMRPTTYLTCPTRDIEWGGSTRNSERIKAWFVLSTSNATLIFYKYYTTKIFLSQPELTSPCENLKSSVHPHIFRQTLSLSCREVSVYCGFHLADSAFPEFHSIYPEAPL